MLLIIKIIQIMWLNLIFRALKYLREGVMAPKLTQANTLLDSAQAEADLRGIVAQLDTSTHMGFMI